MIEPKVRSLKEILSPMLEDILKLDRVSSIQSHFIGIAGALVKSRGVLWTDEEILDVLEDAVRRMDDVIRSRT